LSARAAVPAQRARRRAARASRAPDALERSLGRALAGVVLGLCCIAVLSCGGTRGADWTARHEGPYDALDADELGELARARVELAAGDERGAYSRLVDLAARAPRNLWVGIALQEIELQRLEAGQAIPGIASPLLAGPGDARERLALFYARRAQESTTPTALLLAARLEREDEVAEQLLARAASLDSACAWVPYARAHRLTLVGELPQAREQLDRALELDPDQLAARRLDAALRARSAGTREARAVMERWVEEASGDPRIATADYAASLIDLAILCVLDEDARTAEDLLAQATRLREGMGLPLESREGARVELARSGALESRGRADAALAAARRARELAPQQDEALLALVHEAMLQESWLRDPPAAINAWRAVLAATAQEPSDSANAAEPADPRSEFQQLMLRLQALTRLARLEAQQASSAPATAASRPAS
jgi:tetratricopeptide (TPR) repeat protein